MVPGSLPSMTTTDHPITGVDFAVIPSHDLERSSEFYRDRLGLRRSVFNPERCYSEYETGNLTLSVVDAEGMGMAHTANANAIALHVDDIAAARAALESAGVPFSGETLDTGVCRMAFFADPDGNALMLHSRYAPRVTDD